VPLRGAAPLPKLRRFIMSAFPKGRVSPVPGRVNLSERVYADLKIRMQEFSLVPGDRFSEAEVGARLGVSRTPVREALFRLRNEGLLDVESKSGWFVRPIDFDRLEQLYDLRVVLESASVARLCGSDRPVPELEGLKAFWLVPVADRLQEGREVGAMDEVFHATLVRTAGNDEMARVHWDVTERIRIIRRLDFTRPDRIEATYIEHAKILRAIMQRRSEQAHLLLRTHIEQSKAEVRKITLATLQSVRPQHATGARPPIRALP
jgi:DNA-binding GntR family transcriptional regulator